MKRFFFLSCHIKNEIFPKIETTRSLLFLLFYFILFLLIYKTILYKIMYRKPNSSYLLVQNEYLLVYLLVITMCEY